MIGRYVYRVRAREPFPAGRAYAFYSCLLSLLPGEVAEALHEQGETPVSQCLYWQNGETRWKLHLLDEPTNDAFSAVLDDLRALPLNTGAVGLELVERERFSAEDLIGIARAMEPERFFSLRFLSPTAFKQSGRYAVLPDKELILQSLLKKWTAAFPAYPLEDADAAQMLSDGLRVSDYELRTTRFLLKDRKIPGFIGDLRFEAQLSPPLLEIWKLLLAFSACSGVGIKTALGMGGVMPGGARKGA